ncbi:MAG TPA: VOC family protein [Opitutaceae bacterium]|nr:VOC family protein [Opitutaceae bacterium]
MKIDELNHVALHVSDVPRSSRFYGDSLGLPALPRPAFDFPGAWFRIGAVQELHLIGERLNGPVDEGSRGGHFAMRVPDIEAAAAHLRARGVRFRGPLRRPDGAGQIFLEDPDGHVVELCQLR